MTRGEMEEKIIKKNKNKTNSNQENDDQLG
jgi:hypothetical protein